MTDRELMRQAVVALDLAMLHGEFPQSAGILRDISNAANALSARLSAPEPETDVELINRGCRYTTELTQPEPEPVAYLLRKEFGFGYETGDREDYGAIPVYTTPLQREWQGLTDEEIRQEYFSYPVIGNWGFARAIEAKLREKNT